MGAMTLLATELNAIGKLIYNVLYGWIAGWGISETSIIGAFGVTVIIFTVLLKVIVLPFDFWQKQITRKNAKKMKAMQPELEKIQKQFKNDQQQLYVKQRALNKKYKYSPMKACLPSIVTLVIFFVVFSGFRSACTYHNSVVYDNCHDAYETAYNASLESQTGDVKDTKLAIEAGQNAALEAYEIERFLLTKNIFIGDNWSQPIPDAATFYGTGLGGVGVTGTDSVDSAEYDLVMSKVMAKYNYSESGSSEWNGYLILPIIALILNILSTKLIKPADQPQVAGQTEEQKKSQESSMKMMQWTMPIMMFVFAILYSAAFTLYMVINSLITLVFNLLYNVITKKIDAKKELEEENI